MLLALLLACAFAPGPDASVWPVVSAFTFPSFTVQGYAAYPVEEGGFVVNPIDYGSDIVIGLTDHLDRCAESTDYLRTWADASETLLAASDEGADADAFCAGMPALLESLDAAGARQAQLGHRLDLSLCATCDHIDGAVELSGDEVASATLLVDTEPEPTSLADAWNADTCQVELSEPPDTLAAWSFEGTVDLSPGLIGAYSGTIDVRAADQAYGAEAPLEPFKLDFSTANCAPPDVARLVIY